MSLIELAGIERVFRLGDSTVHALSHLNASIEAGEYVAIMGPSGSGKSTLLNLLGLLDRPDAGVYRLEGRDVTTLLPDEQAAVRSRRIGFVFQSFHLVPRLTAAENIALPMMLAGIPAAERAQQVATALKDFGLEQRADHRPDQLSGGQRQRVAIARATVMQPAVLLADEPTGNLDRATGDDVINLLEALNARGMTLIVVTHDPKIGGRARRQLMMEDGELRHDSAAVRLRQIGGNPPDPQAALHSDPAPAAQSSALRNPASAPLSGKGGDDVSPGAPAPDTPAAGGA